MRKSRPTLSDSDEESRENPFQFVGIAALAIIGSYALIPSGSYDHRIPSVEKVQQGYVAPSEIEIFCEDLDRNGELETIMKIGDTSYLS